MSSLIIRLVIVVKMAKKERQLVVVVLVIIVVEIEKKERSLVVFVVVVVVVVVERRSVNWLFLFLLLLL